MRRTAGGNEVNFIKVESAVRGAPDRQVSVVNRVEGAAKKSDAAGLVLCRCTALRLRGCQ